MADLPGYCALTFTLMPVGSTSQRSVQESGFTEICLLTQLRRLYPLPVRQASALLTASSRFHLTMDTLAVQLTLPLAGCVEDFHLQVSAPCRAHKHKKASSFGWRPFCSCFFADQREATAPPQVVSTCRPCRRRRVRRRLEQPWARAVRPPELRWSAAGPRSKLRSAAPCASLWWDR